MTRTAHSSVVNFLKRLVLCGAAVAPLIAGVGVTEVHARQQIVVMVTGPANSSGPEELVLEIGSGAWSGYGGVVSVASEVPQTVRLIGSGSCRIYAQFVAAPGTNWVVRFSADGTAREEDWTGHPMDLGPLLSERAPSRCPGGADGSPVASSTVALAELAVPALVAAAVLLIAAVAFMFGHGRHGRDLSP